MVTIECAHIHQLNRLFYTGLSVPYKDIHFNELVGRGSYGTVHKGSFNGNVVALKRIPVPSGTDVQTIIADNREIAALRSKYNYINAMTACNFTSKYRMLKHPNIVAFIGYATSETELVLVMEFIEGTNLHQLIFGKQKVITRVSN